jgi:hypothetical protein
MNWYFVAWHWVEVHTGVLPAAPSRAYNFWSGIGSDIGEVAIIAAVIGTYRKFNCHVPHCWRLAHHSYEIDSVEYRLCRKHHPNVDDKSRKTAQDFADHHAAKSAPKGQARDKKGRFA